MTQTRSSLTNKSSRHFKLEKQLGASNLSEKDQHSWAQPITDQTIQYLKHKFLFCIRTSLFSPTIRPKRRSICNTVKFTFLECRGYQIACSIVGFTISVCNSSGNKLRGQVEQKSVQVFLLRICFQPAQRQPFLLQQFGYS